MADPNDSIMRSILGGERNVASSISELPVAQLLEDFGTGIAEAQKKLDENCAAMATTYSNTNIKLGGQDYNLIQLGFIPNFYHFTEGKITLKVTLSSSFGTEMALGAGIGIGSKADQVKPAAKEPEAKKSDAKKSK